MKQTNHRRIFSLLLAAILLCCLAIPVLAEEESMTLRVATYNVGGLPIVGSSDAKRSIEIGKYIAENDIVNIQENFTYHYFIQSQTKKTMKYGSNHLYPLTGLDSFSKYPIKNMKFQKWKTTYGGILNGGGADFYAWKGILSYTVVLPQGELDVYNFHTDAGGSDTATDKNLAARRSNLSQLATLVQQNSISKGRATLIMGDSNCRYTRVNDDFKNLLLDACGLSDAWVELVRGGEFPELGIPSLHVEGTDAVELSSEDPNIEKVDKVLYRSGDTLTLVPTLYRDQKLTQGNKSLSDHNPLQVEFSVY